MAIKKDETEKKVETKETKNAKVDELVEVYIPVDYSDPDEDNLYVAVNGRAMLVPKGQRVKVKPEFAEVINLSLALKDAKRQKEVEARAKAGQEFINTSY